MTTKTTSDRSELLNPTSDSDAVAHYYDEWVEDYDDTLAGWHYQAPDQVAARLRAEVAAESIILDAGCGTGLSGKALVEAGFRTIDGMDVSPRSVEVAQERGIYRNLDVVDMQQLPLPCSDSVYDGLVCVGVMTYLPDSDAILREFCRLVKPGGYLVLTQRNDILEQRDFVATLKGLEDEGVLLSSHVSDPMPYLPENDDFGDDVRVHYITCRAA